MSKKIIYSLVGLALIFFIGSLVIFLRSNRDVKPATPAAAEKQAQEAPAARRFMKVKVFFLTQETRYMKPVSFELEQLDNTLELYRNYVGLLLQPKENYIIPVPEGVSLRSLYLIENKGLLVLDFSEELITQFPAGANSELEFIYYFVDNICYNFQEIKMVKFMIAGNEYKELTGHIDMENPFYPDFRYIRDDQ